MLKLDQATVTEVLSAFQKTFNSDVIAEAASIHPQIILK